MRSSPVLEARWGCCNCGNSAGMSTLIDHCPECLQPRCIYCSWESFAVFDGTGDPLDKSVSNLYRDQVVHHRRFLQKPLGYPVASPSSLPSSPECPSTFSIDEVSTESESEVDLENIETDSEGLDSDDNVQSTTGEFDLLESCLLPFLAHDLDLASRVFRRALQRLRSQPPPDANGWSTGYHAYGTNHSPPNNAYSPSAQKSGPHSTDQGRQLKRSNGHIEPHDNDRDKRRRRNQKPGNTKPQNKAGVPLLFACHFYKRNPSRFVPTPHYLRYKNCRSPSVPSIRLDRILDHFKRHNLEQCYWCFETFENIAELENHRQGPVPCIQQHRSLKETITTEELEAIKYVLRATTDPHKTLFEKWYDIWNILFPDVEPPENPYSEPEIRVITFSPDIPNIMARAREAAEDGIRIGTLRREDSESYMELFQQILESEVTPSSQNSITFQPALLPIREAATSDSSHLALSGIPAATQIEGQHLQSSFASRSEASTSQIRNQSLSADQSQIARNLRFDTPAMQRSPTHPQHNLTEPAISMAFFITQVEMGSHTGAEQAHASTPSLEPQVYEEAPVGMHQASNFSFETTDATHLDILDSLEWPDVNDDSTVLSPTFGTSQEALDAINMEDYLPILDDDLAVLNADYLLNLHEAQLEIPWEDIPVRTPADRNKALQDILD